MLRRIAAARATARTRVWGLVPGGLPASRAAGTTLEAGLVVLDVDATIVIAHSEKEQATRTFKRTTYLPDEALATLSEHLLQGTPTGEPSRWLSNESGKPWHDNLVDYRWRSTRTDVGGRLRAP